MDSQFQLQIKRHTLHAPWTYADLDRAQTRVAKGVLEGESGALFLSEVAPVITVGRRTPDADFNPIGHPIYRVTRGGLATYHGPGQWIVFAVDRLDRLVGDSRGVRKAVEGLLECALLVSRPHCAEAEIRTGCETGVWDPKSGGKLASVGVSVQNGILMHGLALNVYSTPESEAGFNQIRPCGLDRKPAYLSPTESSDILMEVQKSLVQVLSQTFWKNSGDSTLTLTGPGPEGYTGRTQLGAGA